MSLLVQISDPEDLRVTIQVPGKYNPDILEDAKRRCVDAYKEALTARMAAAREEYALEEEAEGETGAE